MDPKAPLSVAQGTLITSVTLSLGASLYGAVKGLPVGPLAVSTAVNSGITGATFFSIREYLISPILLTFVSYPQFVRRKRIFESGKAGKDTPLEPLSWWDMRTHKLPDTAVSGAISGAVLNAWKRGRVGVLPGSVTGSIICTLLQFAYNEIGVMRVKYVSQTLGDAEALPVLQPLKPTPAASEASHGKPSDVLGTGRQSFSDRVFDWFGFHRVADEEYLERLKRQRDAHLIRIAELEKELQEECKEEPKS